MQSDFIGALQKPSTLVPYTMYDPVEHFNSVCEKIKNGMAAGSELEILTQVPL